MKKQNEQFSSLDSLRGLAAIGVATFHFSYGWAGYLAVDFFLVLSGFILSHSYLYRNENLSTLEFVSHRIARLYPLHIFSLLTFCAAFYLMKGTMPVYKDGTLFTFIQNLTLTHNIGLNPKSLTYNFPSWSISVEFWVNILFILYISKKTKNSTLLFIPIVGMLFIYNNTGHIDTTYQNYYGFANSGMIRGISSFCLGILAYRIYLNIRGNAALYRYVLAWQILCVLIIFMIVDTREKLFSPLDIFTPFIFMFTVIAFAMEKGALSIWLGKIRYLGTISYSIYLNQLTVLYVVMYCIRSSGIEMPKYYIEAIFLVTLIIYSHLTYVAIERPCRVRGRNFLSKVFNGKNNPEPNDKALS